MKYFVQQLDNGCACSIVPDDFEGEGVLLDSKPFDSDPLLWKIVSKTVLEDDALVALDLEAKEEALEKECFDYWYNLMAPTTFALYESYKAVSAKAQENIDWVNALWVLFETKVTSKDWSSGFDAHGNPPHKFSAVRTEAEAV